MKINKKNYPPLGIFRDEGAIYIPKELTGEKVSADDIMKMMREFKTNTYPNLFSLSAEAEERYSNFTEVAFDSYFNDPKKPMFAGAYLYLHNGFPCMDLFNFFPAGKGEDIDVKGVFASIQEDCVLTAAGALHLKRLNERDLKVDIIGEAVNEEEKVAAGKCLGHIFNMCCFRHYAPSTVIKEVFICGNDRVKLPDSDEVIQNYSGIPFHCVCMNNVAQ